MAKLESSGLDDPGLILVTGATGKQGSATTRALLLRGARVRILVRDPAGEAAQALVSLGAEAAPGDLTDRASLAAALEGVAALFSIPVTFEEQARPPLIEEALRAGVRRVVHTSMMGAGKFAQLPRWREGYWEDVLERNWLAKSAQEEFIRSAGFERVTLIRPGFFMDNFIGPAAPAMFPGFRTRCEIATTWQPDTKMALTSTADIGAFAAAALLDPARFDGEVIQLVAEILTVEEIATILAKVLEQPIRFVQLSREEALARGQHPFWVRAQEAHNLCSLIGRGPFAADPKLLGPLRDYGVSLTPLAQWAERMRPAFHFDCSPDARLPLSASS